ncbi:unnamed protein product [Rotaria magnacalcarata]|nr:unnamed protein product [Rotaria magnacalcarata]
MEYSLTKELNATMEELVCVKRLCALNLKPRGVPSKRPDHRKPSTIIDDFLYHGNIGHAQNIDLLKQLDIQHILNVCDEELNQEILDHFDVLWINIDDDISADIRKHFEQSNNFLHLNQQKGEKVLVHCKMGISRSSAIILAYLMNYRYKNLYAAYDYLLQCRRVALPNAAFFLHLVRYENELSISKTNDSSQLPMESSPGQFDLKTESAN